MDKISDVIIIGGGVAGCSAALYSARRELDTVVITKDIGGQLVNAHIVENYPGIDSESGVEISQKIKKQAEKFGAKFIYNEVTKIKLVDEKFHIVTANKEYIGHSVILSVGKEPRKLNIKGEKEFLGKGVSYCAICDGPLFRNKIVAVVGGGNSALDAASFLSSITKEVILIHRRDKFRAEPEILKNFISKKNIKLFKNSRLKEVSGTSTVESIKIYNLKTHKEKKVNVNGVFVEIGYEVNVEFVKDLVDTNERGEVKINLKNETKTHGLFAAGDLVPTPYKQAIISASSGVVAALSAWEYIECKQTTSPKWECPKK